MIQVLPVDLGGLCIGMDILGSSIVRTPDVSHDQSNRVLVGGFDVGSNDSAETNQERKVWMTSPHGSVSYTGL